MADLRIDDRLRSSYDDVLTSDVIGALHALARFDETRQQVMQLRLERRAKRARSDARIAFLDPSARIPGTSLSVQDARDGRFPGSEIPHDLERPLPVNVDGAIAAISADLGFAYELGNAIFLISRLPGLIAHAHEERTRQSPMRQIDPKDHDYDGARQRRVPEGRK